MVMVPGSLNVVRVNGRAVVSDDPAVTQSFEQHAKHPKTVIIISVDEVSFQGAKALMRSVLWTRDDGAGLPSSGDFIKEQDAGFDAEGYDLGYPTEAPKRMW